MQVEQHWPEGSSDSNEGLNEAEATQDLADVDSAKADSAGTSTAQHEISEHACTSDDGANTKQKESQSLAERQDDQSGDGTTADVVEEAVDEAYIMAYLGRHMCPQEVQSAHMSGEACGGTMTPVGVHGDTYVCNMCDYERSESERIAELSRMFQEISDDAVA